MRRRSACLRLALSVGWLFFSLGISSATSVDRIDAVVLSVIDGDTVRLSDGTRVRYRGIDTPEIRKKVGRHWVYDPQPYALEARRLNRTWVEGKVVRLEVDPAERHDRHGRLLAAVFVDSRFVNTALVEAGLARVYRRSPHGPYGDRLDQAEARAKHHRLGIWSEKRR